MHTSTSFKKAIALGLILFATHANALSIDDLSNSEASGGLKAALIQGAGKAVSKLGAVDGFFGNKEVKIPLPDTMKKAEKAMRMFGMGKQADELVLKMNRAAEAAVPEAKAFWNGTTNADKAASLNPVFRNLRREEVMFWLCDIGCCDKSIFYQ